MRFGLQPELDRLQTILQTFNEQFGDIDWHDKDRRLITDVSQRKWRRLRRTGVLQYVFQDPLRSLDPDLTVEESLVEPLLIQGRPRREAGSASPRP